MRTRTSQTRKLINVLLNRVGSILDTEVTWLGFLSDATRGDNYKKSHFHRVNPDIHEEPPRLDDTKRLPHLRRRLNYTMKDKLFQEQIGEIARRLIASSFYLEPNTKPKSRPEDNSIVFGMVHPVPL